MSQIFSCRSDVGSEAALFAGLEVDKAEDLYQRVNVPCSSLV